MGKQKVGIILRFGAFLPESFEYQFCMAGFLTYPGFMKPSHPECYGQWQVFHKTIIPRTRDRASQQRVLLRIQTAFPFNYNDFISL